MDPNQREVVASDQAEQLKVQYVLLAAEMTRLSVEDSLNKSENKGMSEENENMRDRFDSLQIRLGDLAAMAADFNMTPRSEELDMVSIGSLENTQRVVFRRENINELLAIQTVVAGQNNTLMSQREIMRHELNSLRTEIEKLNEFIIEEGKVSPENREILVRNLNKFIQMKFAEHESKLIQAVSTDHLQTSPQKSSREEEDALRKEVMELKRAVERLTLLLRESSQDLENERNKNIQQLKSHHTEKETLNEKIRSLERTNEDLRSELEEARKTSLKPPKDQSNPEEKSPSNKLARYSISIIQADRLKQDIEDKSRQISDLNDELDEKRSQISKLKADLDSLKFDLDLKSQELDRTIKKNQQSETRLQREVQAAKDHADAVIREMDEIARNEREVRQHLIITKAEIEILFKDNDQLKYDILELKAQLETWKNKQKQTADEVVSKLEHIQSLENKIVALQQQVDDSNKDSETAAISRIKSRYEEEISLAQHENDVLRKKLKEKQQEIVDLTVELEKNKTQRPPSDESANDNANIIRDLKSKLRVSQDETADIKILLQQKERMIEELQKELAELESLQKEVTSKSAELQAISKKLREKEQEADELTFKVVQNSSKYAKEIREKQEEIEDLRQLIQTIRNERQKSSELDMSIDNEEVSRLKIIIQSLEEQNNQLEEDLSKLKRFTKQKDQQIGELLDKIEQQADADRRAMQAREREIKEESAEREGRLSRLVDELKIERDNLKEKLANLEREESEQVASLKDRLNLLSEESRKLKDSEDQLRSQLISLKRDLDSQLLINEGYLQKEKRLLEVIAERDRIEAELINQKRQNRGKEEAEQRADELSLEIEALESQKARLKEDLTATRKELEEVSSRLLIEKRAKGDLEVKCEVLERRIAEVNRERDEAISKSAKDRELEEKLRNLDEQVYQLTKVNDRLRDQISRLELDNEGLVRKNREKNEEVNACQQEIDLLKLSLKKAEESKNEDVFKKEKDRDLINRINQLTEEVDKLRATIRSKESEIDDLKRALSRSKSEAEDSDRRIREKTAEVEYLKAMLEDSGIQRLKQEVADFDRAVKDLNEKLREKNAQLVKSLEERDLLSEQLRASKRKIDNLEQNLEDLQISAKEQQIILEEVKESLREKGLPDRRLPDRSRSLMEDLEQLRQSVKKLEEELLLQKLRHSEAQPASVQDRGRRAEEGGRSPSLLLDSHNLMGTQDSTAFDALERELRRKAEEAQRYRSELRVVEGKYEEMLNEMRHLKEEVQDLRGVLSRIGLRDASLKGLDRQQILMQIPSYRELLERLDYFEKELKRRSGDQEKQDRTEERARHLRELTEENEKLNQFMLELHQELEALTKENNRLKVVVEEHTQLTKQLRSKDESGMIESRVTEIGGGQSGRQMQTVPINPEELEKLHRELKKAKKTITLYEQRIRELELENEELNDNLDKNLEVMKEKYNRIKDKMIDQEESQRLANNESYDILKKRIEELTALIGELKATNKILEEARKSDIEKLQDLRKREEALKEAEQRMHALRQRMLEKEKQLQAREDSMNEAENIRKEALKGLEDEIQKARNEIDNQIMELVDKNLVNEILSSEREPSQFSKYLRLNLKSIKNPSKVIDEFG